MRLDKEKKLLCVFAALALIICLVPLVGMTFARTDQTTEKKELAPLPSLVEDGHLNTDYLSGLGDYFNDHFAFRQELVSFDSILRGRIFGVSSDDSVVVGRDGWLFYSDTLNDFTGSAPMSERKIFNIANNLSLTQSYVESTGAQFVFTIAPNKNTLYPQYMPYTYSAAERSSHNAVVLGEQLTARGVNYVDLFELFDGQDEVLYLARDSHWNNRGALLSCEALLSAVSHTDVSFSQLEGTVTDDYVGDLNLMLYPLGAQPESNIDYAIDNYTYTNGASSVEDPIIVTSASDVQGSLLMYRDSFGNTMLPFMASSFSSACFVRTVPYNLGTYSMIYQPTVVIIEKVERSIDELSSMPPVFETGDTELLISSAIESDSTLSVCEPAENIMFWRIDGVLDSTVLDPLSRIFVRISDQDGFSVTREAFTMSTDSSDFGLRAYINKDLLASDEITVEAVASVGGVWTVVASNEVVLSSIPPAF